MTNAYAWRKLSIRVMAARRANDNQIWLIMTSRKQSLDFFVEATLKNAFFELFILFLSAWKDEKTFVA